MGLPLVMALLAVPLLIANIGTERFGLLGLAWGLVGYASVLDFGMSRALTQKLAINRNQPEELQARAIVRSAVSLTFVISAVFMAGMIWLSAAGVENLFSVQQVTASELAISTLILALTLPIQAVSMAYRGINEAYLNFRGISLVRIFLGVANFGAPCALSFFTNRVDHLVLTLFIARVCALAAFAFLSRRCLPPTPATDNAAPSGAHIRSLLQFGGWVAVSSVLVPVLMTSDRFVIGALINADAVTTYVIPYDMLTQGLFIVGAITTIAFPSISQLSKTDPQTAFDLFFLWTKRITLLVLIMQIALFIFLPDILRIWIGDSLDPAAVTVGRVLIIGVCAYPIGTMCTSYLHAYAKTKVVAVIQIIETPVYLLLLGYLILHHAEIGAAVAWTLRVTIDSILLTVAVMRTRAQHRRQP